MYEKLAPLLDKVIKVSPLVVKGFGADFDGLVGFLDTHPIITVPSRVPPLLRETPPFMRATTFASMDTPGPYEQQATEAYFYVTLPDPAWPAARVAGFMTQFNHSVISNVVVHEAYPGHYLQFLWMHQVDDRVRRLFGASSNAEGWAHYCEQMMLDEGFGQPGAGARDARQALLLRLGQLQDALLRDARYVVGLRMHTGDMSFEQGVQFFVDDFLLARDLMRDGVGVGILPTFVARTYVREGLLEEVPVSGAAAMGGELVMLYPSSGQTPKKVTAFRDFIVEALRSGV